MKTNYLLPHKYKLIGWFFLLIGICFGIFTLCTDYESDILSTKVLSFYNNDALFANSTGYFQFIENSIVDEIAVLMIIVGGFLVGFTKEKVEDEFIAKLRSDSLIWAIIANYAILLFAIIFVYGFSFFDVLVFNMFTPLLFFIFRFNFLKHKYQSHEE